MNLIPNWRQAPKMLSVRFTALLVAWLALPDATQLQILGLLPITKDQVTGILAILSALGRVTAQPKLHTQGIMPVALGERIVNLVASLGRMLRLAESVPAYSYPDPLERVRAIDEARGVLDQHRAFETPFGQ